MDKATIWFRWEDICALKGVGRHTQTAPSSHFPTNSTRNILQSANSNRSLVHYLHLLNILPCTSSYIHDSCSINHTYWHFQLLFWLSIEKHQAHTLLILWLPPYNLLVISPSDVHSTRMTEMINDYISIALSLSYLDMIVTSWVVDWVGGIRGSW